MGIRANGLASALYRGALTTLGHKGLASTPLR